MREINVKDFIKDGNLFFKIAFDNGASVCVLENFEGNRDEYKDKTILIVENSIKALQEIATFKRAMYDIPVVGITGSVGKTSTKDLIASVMAEKYETLKTIGNYNNHIGVPLTILELNNHQAAVVEMGMNHLGEIDKITKIAKPTMGVITNIGTAHIGILGSRKNILRAKLEILEGMDEKAPLIINNDNDMLHDWYLKNKTKREIITYGIENESDIMAKNIIATESGSKFEVKVGDRVYNADINVAGNHFVLNALCAICVGIQNDIYIDSILNGIKKFKLTANRMEITDTKQGVKLINDSYNASYDSMKAALESLKSMSRNRKIAVLGDILELGDFAKSIHEKVGEEVYKNKIDILITVGDNARFIADKAVSLGMDKDNVFSFETNNKAIGKLKEIMEVGDCVLVKASNSMNFKEIAQEVKSCNYSEVLY